MDGIPTAESTQGASVVLPHYNSCRELTYDLSFVAAVLDGIAQREEPTSPLPPFAERAPRDQGQAINSVGDGRRKPLPHGQKLRAGPEQCRRRPPLCDEAVDLCPQRRRIDPWPDRTSRRFGLDRMEGRDTASGTIPTGTGRWCNEADLPVAPQLSQ
jgi:hypothetical protein